MNFIKHILLISCMALSVQLISQNKAGGNSQSVGGNDVDGVCFPSYLCLNVDTLYTLEQAYSLDTGYYSFDVDNDDTIDFRSYVDTSGWVRIALDYGDGVGVLSQSDTLLSQRGILTENLLSLLDFDAVRISHSGGSIDYQNNTTAVVNKVKTFTSIHAGAGDNVINDDWVGTNDQYATNNAICVSQYNPKELDALIFHACGNTNTTLWAPVASSQMVAHALGQIPDAESLSLWVRSNTIEQVYSSAIYKRTLDCDYVNQSDTTDKKSFDQLDSLGFEVCDLGTGGSGMTETTNSIDTIYIDTDSTLTLTATGRLSTYNNSDRTFRQYYGNTHQIWDNVISLTAPEANLSGLLIDDNSILQKITVKVSYNTNDTSGDWYEKIYVLRNNAFIFVDEMHRTNISTTDQFYTLTPNFTLLPNDQLFIVGRSENGGGNRLCAYNAVFQLVKT